MTRIVFMGTPMAAVPTLNMLYEHFDLGLVVTQPDRESGRRRRLTAPPVKQRALELEVPVAQPRSSPELWSVLDEHGPWDLGCVVAYGRILKPDVLDVPRSGYLNIHFSLLPRWRGAAPVARALMAGDTMTGVTIMKIDQGLDSGPVLTAQAVDITGAETAGELEKRLAQMGATLLRHSIGPYLSKEMIPVDQSDDGATYAPKITGEDRLLSARMGTLDFVNAVRALTPTPGASLVIDGLRFKILEAETAPRIALASGHWIAHGGWPVLGLADGSVILRSLQPPGKAPRSGTEWLNGLRVTSGVAG